MTLVRKIPVLIFEGGGVSINSIFFQNNSKTPVCLVESILYYLNVHVLTFTFLDMLTLIGYDSDQ